MKKGWPVKINHQDGLTYPLTISKTSGAKLVFYSSQEYHEYIAQLFQPKTLTKKTK